MHSAWGFLKLLVSTMMGNSQEPQDVKRAMNRASRLFYIYYEKHSLLTSGIRSPWPLNCQGVLCL